MRKFDTKVQYLKYKVLREVARQAWNDTLLDNVLSTPRELAPRNAETHEIVVNYSGADMARLDAAFERLAEIL